MTIQVQAGRLRWLLAELAAAGVSVLGVDRAPDGSMRVTVDPVDGDAARTVAQEVNGYVSRGRLVATKRRSVGGGVNTFDVMVGCGVLALGAIGVLALVTGNPLGAAFMFAASLAAAIVGPRWSAADKRAQQALRDAGLAVPNRWFDAVLFGLSSVGVLAAAGAVWAAHLGWLP